jgi:hypothetical protein
MNNEAESARAGQRRSTMAGPDTAHDAAAARADIAREHGAHDHDAPDGDDGDDGADGTHDPALREQRVQARRLDAKRKRVVFLDHLLRELDTLVFLELIALYHLEYICRGPPACLRMLTRVAARSSGLLFAPWSTAPCSRRCPTSACTASTTSTSPSCL